MLSHTLLVMGPACTARIGIAIRLLGLLVGHEVELSRKRVAVQAFCHHVERDLEDSVGVIGSPDGVEGGIDVAILARAQVGTSFESAA